MHVSGNAPLVQTRRAYLRSAAGEYLGMGLALSVLVLVFGLLTEHFFSLTTFRTIANQIPAAIVIATGLTFVLVIAEIDLSVGSVVGLCSALIGIALVAWQWPLWAALAAGMGLGAACGAFNGLITVRWRLPSFIVTLGMLEMARGGAHFLTQSQTQYIGSRIEAIAAASVFGLSGPFLYKG
jgi:ribose transport system permease protein